MLENFDARPYPIGEGQMLKELESPYFVKHTTGRRNRNHPKVQGGGHLLDRRKNL
jgi:hypothetical protein